METKEIVGLPPIGEGPKADPVKKEVEILANKVQGLFSFLSQETISEQTLSHIHEPRQGWKEELLQSYSSDDLVGCADLVDEAIEDCIQTAKTLKEAAGPPLQKDFLEAVATLGTSEKEEMVLRSLSKDLGQGGLLSATTSIFSIGAKLKLGSQVTKLLDFASTFNKYFAATKLNPVLVAAAEAPAFITDVMQKNWAPPVVAVTTCVVVSLAIPAIPIVAPIAPTVLGAAKIGFVLGTTAADILRLYQSKKRLNKLKRSKKGDISRNLRPISVKNRLHLERKTKLSDAEATTISQKIRAVSKLSSTNPSIQKIWEDRFPVPMEIVGERPLPSLMEIVEQKPLTPPAEEDLAPPPTKKTAEEEGQRPVEKKGKKLSFTRKIPKRKTRR